MDDKLQMDMSEYLPLRDIVFQTLRKAILKGDLKPGERLMEIALAQKLGVSRTPVREAIRKLELEGLAIMIPRRGAIVADITIEDLEDVLEVREALEVLAIEKACELMSEEDLQKLKEAAEVFRQAAGKGELMALVETDIDFHELIYRAADNKRLEQTLRNLREQMYRYRMEYLKDKSTYAALVAEHEEIINAIAQRDKAAAREAIRVHIINQKNGIIRSLK
ncbi:MAG: GntR family transcriptional regulator [Eubacteriales bacterium]|nr:GntR family transcriptional regulator [Eubacteriales bacterium]